jgi:hypothetical protein
LHSLFSPYTSVPAAPEKDQTGLFAAMDMEFFHTILNFAHP